MVSEPAGHLLTGLDLELGHMDEGLPLARMQQLGAVPLIQRRFLTWSSLTVEQAGALLGTYPLQPTDQAPLLR